MTEGAPSVVQDAPATRGRIGLIEFLFSAQAGGAGLIVYNRKELLLRLGVGAGARGETAVSTARGIM